MTIQSLKLLKLVFLVCAFFISSVSYAGDLDSDTNTHDGTEGANTPEDMEHKNSCNSSSQTGSPVYLKSLALVWQEVDVELPGRPYIGLQRTYNSTDKTEGVFGKGWSTRCERSLTKRVVIYQEPGLVSAKALNQHAATASKTLTIIDSYYVYLAGNGRSYEFRDPMKSGALGAPRARGLPGVGLFVQPSGNLRLQGIDGSYDEFNFAGKIVSESDRNGNVVNYTYEDDALTRIADTNGRYLELFYDSTGHVTTVQDHIGRQWLYGYDINGLLISRTNPLDGVKTYTYEISSVEFAEWKSYRLTEVKDESGVVEISVSYSSVGKVVTYTEGENVYTYQTNHLTPDKRKKSDSVGNIWNYELDELWRKSKVDPAYIRGAEHFTYTDDGQVLSYIDLLNNETLYEYNEFKQLVVVKDLDGELTIEYNEGKPWPIKVTSRAGRIQQGVYDEFGNILEYIDAENNRYLIEWSEKGDLLSVTNPLDQKRKQTFNSIGQVLTQRNAQDEEITYTYDSLGYLTDIISPLGWNVATYEYDDLGRLILSIDAEGNQTTLSYDAASRLLDVEAPNGNHVSYEYDDFGRLSRRVDYDGGAKTFEYFADNRVSRIEDKSGLVTEFAYDSARRMTKKTTGETALGYSYSPLSQIKNAVVIISGKTVPNSPSNSYDHKGRLVSVNGKNPIAYTYDADGFRTTMTISGYQGSGLTSYQYDNRGILTQLTNSMGSIGFEIDALGRRSSMSLPNGSSAQYKYTPAGHIESIQHSGVFNAHYQYGYDVNGQMTSIAGDGIDKHLSYSKKGQLVAADGYGESLNYSYDILGNLQGNGQVYDVANRLIEDDDFSYTYDLRGSLLTKQNKSTGSRIENTWDVLGQLASVTRYPDSVSTVPTATSSFQYDAFGRRVNAIRDGVEERYLYDGQNRVETHGSNSALINHVAFGQGIDQPLMMLEGGTAYGLHANHQGSVMALSDSNGVVANYAYTPFGRTTVTGDANINPFRYTGREFEADDLYYYRARYYDPQNRRFTSSDPIGLRGGLNTYGYVGGNPVSFNDPMGETPLHVGFVCAATAIGTAGGFIAGVVQEGAGSLMDGSDFSWSAVANTTITTGLGAFVGSVSAVSLGTAGPVISLLYGNVGNTIAVTALGSTVTGGTAAVVGNVVK